MRKVNPFFVSTVSLVALSASPALAAQAQPDASPQAVAATPTLNCDVPAGVKRPAECETITVTGTRIRRPNLESPLPVTSVGGQEFFQTGNVSIGDKLAELPSIASTFTQANSTRFLGTSGLNLLDLRGLGTARTLVLVNGRRHVGGDVLSTGVSVDTNTIPTDLIDRVDVVTGGNSAVYGSDAIAGVVNFVLKDHYNGIQLRAQGGQSTYGDANSYFISALVGKNFADGRGNIAVNLEYARRDQAFGSDRDWFRHVLTVVDADAAGTPNGSDGNVDRILNRDFRSATFNNTGNIRFGGPGTPLNCGIDPQGNPYTCPFIFMPNGDLVAQTGTRTGIGPNGQFIGGNGEGFFSGHQIQITPNLDRYNINLVGHFEVTPAFVPFVEAKFSRTDTIGTGANGPAFITGGTFVDPLQFITGRNRERFSIDDPFLSAQARATICAERVLQGSSACTAPGSVAPTTFAVQESMLGLGNRTEEARRDTFRIVGGIRGDIGGNWNYEASINYGQLKETTTIKGNLDVQRFLLANDAVPDGAGGITCRSKVDPNAAFGYFPWFYYQYYGANYPGADPNAAARLANDVAQCVPVNPLGGNFTQAQRDYLLLDTVAIGKTKQFDATAFISGDTSKFFELPGGPIGVVLGLEYRTDDLFYHQDPQVTLGYTFYNSIPTFDAEKSKVKEAFGEIRLPIVKDLPFLRELEISGAARVSHYSLGSTGTVWAYNGNAIWSPVAGVRLRGNYARAVRAPNQVELFTPFGQNFALVGDPCDADNIGQGTANRATNCAAAGVPAGQQINYVDSLPFKSGGNEGLSAEKSDSITLGGVITPRFLPGFSASVDYYNIKVKKAIQFLSAQFVLDQCYDSATLNNPFCAFFQRAGAGGGHDGLPFGIVDNSLHVTPFNFAKLKTRGLDIEVAYRHKFGNIGQVDTRLNWTHVFELTNFVDPTDPTFGDRILSELGNPQDAFNWNASLQHGRFTLGYQMRYIGKMVVDAFEDWNSFQGRPPQNADFADHQFYPSVFYHDLRLGVDIGPKYNFYLGADNITNTKPPYNASGIGGGSAIYDSIGRFYYAGVVAKF